MSCKLRQDDAVEKTKELEDHYLNIYSKQVGATPLYSVKLVGASLTIHASNRVIIKAKNETYWLKFLDEDDCRGWLCAFQSVAGLYRRLDDFYEVKETYGEGATCRVHECTNRLTGKSYALKTRLDPFDELGRLGMYNELRILQILSKTPHPAIPTLEDYIFDKNGDIKIVMELLEHGNLCDMIERNGPLEENQAKVLFRQIAEGLLHLHQNCVGHRDIKPTNIMLAQQPNGQLQCKIIDYDLAKENYAEHWFAHNPCGTTNFMAPEVMNAKIYGLAVDVWSLGCLLYVMLTGCCPFRGSDSTNTRTNVLNNNLNTEKLSALSVEARQLVLQILDPCPEKRPAMKQVLAHPWLRPGC